MTLTREQLTEAVLGLSSQGPDGAADACALCVSHIFNRIVDENWTEEEYQNWALSQLSNLTDTFTKVAVMIPSRERYRMTLSSMALFVHILTKGDRQQAAREAINLLKEETHANPSN